MSIDQRISMEPVREKLRNLRKFMPGKHDLVYELGAYLADNLSSPEDPKVFELAALQSLYELERGIDRFNNPIKNELVGHLHDTYEILKEYVPGIAKATCPEDFAKAVKDSWKQTNTEPIEKQSAPGRM